MTHVKEGKGFIPAKAPALLKRRALGGRETWLACTARFSPAARPSCNFLISVNRLALLLAFDTALVKLCSLCKSFCGRSAACRSSPAGQDIFDPESCEIRPQQIEQHKPVVALFLPDELCLCHTSKLKRCYGASQVQSES